MSVGWIETMCVRVLAEPVVSATNPVPSGPNREGSRLVPLLFTANAAGLTTRRPVMPRTVAGTVSVTSRGPLKEVATATKEPTFSSARRRTLVRLAAAAVTAEAAVTGGFSALAGSAHSR